NSKFARLVQFAIEIKIGSRAVAIGDAGQATFVVKREQFLHGGTTIGRGSSVLFSAPAFEHTIRTSQHSRGLAGLCVLDDDTVRWIGRVLRDARDFESHAVANTGWAGVK